MHKQARISVAVCSLAMLIAVCWIGSSAIGQNIPTTQPLTTQPADELPGDSPIRKWFAKLTDPDPKVRDQAKQDLMGISADDLPKLRQLVIENRPIAPGQAAALRDIVCQSFLASEKYTIPGGEESDSLSTNGSSFFLGLLWGYEEAENRLGATVEDRLPGFPSYRLLRTGDMILGVYLHPTTPLQKEPEWPTPNVTQVRGALNSSPLTQNIVLHVLRDGEVMNIPVKLAPRPLDADPLAPGALKAFTGARADRAETYWQENFAPLLLP